MKSGPLDAMDAAITTTHYGGVVTFSTLVVEHCEPCLRRDGRSHAHVIPFHDGPCERVTVPGLDHPVLVWQRVSGSTVADITLSPSYMVPSGGCAGVHGFVRNGRWEDC